MSDYPVAQLNPVRRLHVLARSIPGAVYGQAVVDAPHERVWQFVSDMDTSMPLLLPNFRLWHTIERDGERLRACATGRLGLRSLFDVTLQSGLCIMQDRRFAGGMAATHDDRGTRFAVLVGFRGPGRHLGILLRPLGPLLARRIAHRLHAAMSAVG